MPVYAVGSGVWKCGDYENCGKSCCVLAEGKTKSSLGFGNENEPIYPELQDHPRRGIPSHGRPDKQPITGGEFFNSRATAFSRDL
jgi:hypothetical protein